MIIGSGETSREILPALPSGIMGGLPVISEKLFGFSC